MKKIKKFKCALCGETFSKVDNEIWNEAIAMEEYRRLYPGYAAKSTNLVITCDDCHNMIQEWRQENGDTQLQ